ncbi:hypothetical protein Q3G72_007138 [Acer saccharum]|nr:hypothetical protein Q3G72_007138 [Acer saccharum]
MKLQRERLIFLKKAKRREYPSKKLGFGGEKLDKVMMSESVSNIESCFVDKKRVKTPTFNQLTAPYHEPFCLDIFILNAFAVRACIVHRVTSKVVAMAHSISMDMKLDLGSNRNTNACAAIGSILAHRVRGDYILDVVYTPKERGQAGGKAAIVLQVIIDNGVNVKGFYCSDRKRFIAITWRCRNNQDNQRQQEVLLLGIAYEK